MTWGCLLQIVVYTGPSPAVESPDGTIFALGESVDVDDDDLATSLLTQGCFLSAADYAAQQSSAAQPAVASDVTPPEASSVTTVPISDPTPDN